MTTDRCSETHRWVADDSSGWQLGASERDCRRFEPPPRRSKARFVRATHLRIGIFVCSPKKSSKWVCKPAR
jgi:hypothetical protein